MTYCYGIGALLVLIGAILKLTHWLPILWENFLIAAGLAIEVVIFILETLAKQHEDEKNDDSLLLLSDKSLKVYKSVSQTQYLCG